MAVWGALLLGQFEFAFILKESSEDIKPFLKIVRSESSVIRVIWIPFLG